MLTTRLSHFNMTFWSQKNAWRVFVCCAGGVALSGCSGFSHTSTTDSQPPPMPPRNLVPPRWRMATPKESKNAQQVVQEQLRAFRDRDYQKAIDLETERFAASLSTPQQLSRLIETSYPAFNHVRSIRWRRIMINDVDKSVNLGLRFTTTRKEVVGARYLLKWEKNRYLVDGIEARMLEQEVRVSKPWPFKPVF